MIAIFLKRLRIAGVFIFKLIYARYNFVNAVYKQSTVVWSASRLSIR